MVFYSRIRERRTNELEEKRLHRYHAYALFRPRHTVVDSWRDGLTVRLLLGKDMYAANVDYVPYTARLCTLSRASLPPRYPFFLVSATPSRRPASSLTSRDDEATATTRSRIVLPPAPTFICAHIGVELGEKLSVVRLQWAIARHALFRASDKYRALPGGRELHFSRVAN